MPFQAAIRTLATAKATVGSYALAWLAAPPFGPAPTDPAVADRRNALQLYDLTEKLVSYDSTNDDFSGESPTLADTAQVAYELFDADGEPVGKTKGIGRMVYQEKDGAFVAYYSEEIRLSDGTLVRTGGLVNDARLTAGETATIQAVGVSGPFRGAVGFRQFRPVSTHKEYASAIVLYRR